MNWSDPMSEESAPEDRTAEEALPGAKDSEQTPDQALYPGDSGELSLAARRVLVQLLAGPALDAERHSKLWPILIRDEAAIRSRLSELFLQHRDLQVAFTRQAETGDLDAPRLLRRANLTLLDSIVLLHLRQRLTQGRYARRNARWYRALRSSSFSGFTSRPATLIGRCSISASRPRSRRSRNTASCAGFARARTGFEISPTLKAAVLGRRDSGADPDLPRDARPPCRLGKG